jgi:hypothetical protein
MERRDRPGHAECKRGVIATDPVPSLSKQLVQVASGGLVQGGDAADPLREIVARPHAPSLKH